jgi:hypothetical protein
VEDCTFKREIFGNPIFLYVGLSVCIIMLVLAAGLVFICKRYKTLKVKYSRLENEPGEIEMKSL